MMVRIHVGMEPPVLSYLPVKYFVYVLLDMTENTVKISLVRTLNILLYFDCLFVCLPELVPEGKSVSGYISTHNNRPGH